MRPAAVVALLTAAVVAVGTAGCSNSTTPSSVASKAASAASSVGSEATGAASKAASAAESLASGASDTLASASAEAKDKLDAVKGGVDAAGDVRLGTAATGADGRTTVGVSAHNTTDSAKNFAVEVDFRDSGGNLLDVVAVTVSNVAAGKTGTATATSHRQLTGTVKTEVQRALRY
ncbi:hypothetical protein ACFRI7_06070 [Streptomyces sp. NPDC056716]|uniref:hypothetical protein n=1 Tax=unclassified Streptomyces TaxID=2593676 RepID=UPI0036C4C776